MICRRNPLLKIASEILHASSIRIIVAIVVWVCVCGGVFVCLSLCVCVCVSVLFHIELLINTAAGERIVIQEHEKSISQKWIF